MSERQDGWSNFFTGVGSIERDPRTGWYVSGYDAPEAVQEQRWGYDGLTGRIVELPAQEMTREGGVVSLGKGYEAHGEKLKAKLDELSAWSAMSKAIMYSRAFGGGGVVMAIDDGMPWDKPVNYDTAQDVVALHPSKPSELMADRWYTDPYHPRFGSPATYRWMPFAAAAGGANRIVHRSRVIAFQGIDLGRNQRIAHWGWGVSIVDRAWEALRNVASSLSSAAALTQNFSQAVMGLANLAQLLSDKQGKEKLTTRVEAMRMGLSELGVLLIDKDEKYERSPTPVSGLADLIRSFFLNLTAVTGIPVTVLLGESPAGLNATGEGDRRNWFDWVRAQQRNQLTPGFNELIKAILRSKTGPTGGVEPPTWMLEYNPLSTPTDDERAKTEKTVAETAGILVDREIVHPTEVARSMANRPAWTYQMTVDPDLRRPEPILEPEAPADPGEVVEVPEGTDPAQLSPKPVDLQATALNGAQMKAVQEIVASIARREIPRSAGVLMIAQFLNMSEVEADRMVGPTGISFFSGSPARPPTADAAPPAGLRESRWKTFDPAYAEDLRENWPEIWTASANKAGAVHHQRLAPVVARGGSPTSPVEVHAVRARELWAEMNGRKSRLAGVVAMIKRYVVGEIGEDAMKGVVEEEKERVRRRRGTPT